MYEDIYFLNPAKALLVAKEQNRWGPNNYYLQLCYYEGEKIESDLPNLIHLPLDNMTEELVYGTYRIPTRIDLGGLDLSQKVKDQLTESFADSIEQVKIYRNEMNGQYFQKSLQNIPDFNEPLRFFLMASISTQVMQYVSKNISDTLKSMGYEVLFYLMVGIEDESSFKAISEFNPHVIININHINNSFVNESVFNFIWFQDPMPVLSDDSEIQLRQRDIVYSLSDTIMSKKFTKDMYEVWRFCVNKNIYFRDETIEKKNKIVFIGSSYINTLQEYAHLPQVQQVYQLLKEKLNKGERIDKTFLENLAIQYDITYEGLIFIPLAIAVRECCVEWICRQKIIDVEVYGRYWEDNEIVSPYFKGEIPHGEEVAKVYNSAKYALLAHSFDMYQQRLPEMAACGTIPVAYNAIGITENEYKYENETLLFSSFEELSKALQSEPKKSVYNISEDMSFERLVQHMIDTVHERVANE